MSGGLVQDHRIASLDTPLGKDVLALTSFEGTEGVSELFEFRVDALSKDENIDFNKVIGRNCSVKFKSYKGAERIFNGILVAAQWTGVKDVHYAYRLVFKPWLWLLSHTSDSKIHVKKTAPDIIKQVFSDAEFRDFRESLTASYPTIEYCVQYRESDLDFVCRLMEEFGIYYYFEHTSDKHTLVLADSKSSHKAIPGGTTVPYIDLEGRDRRDCEHLYHWTRERTFQAGKVTLKDYDQLRPSAEMTSEAQASEGYNKANLEVYDYPGKYPRGGPTERKKTSDGDKFAKIRLEAAQARDHRRYATGDAISLYPGGLIKLDKHPAASENVQYLVIRASHSFGTEAYRSGFGSNEVYTGRYEFLGSDRPFRAPLITPKPIIHGPQTAKVVGQQGEEIDVDEHGRITVQFHWDRDKKPSRRVRVAQVWSGKTWGGQHIPRIGQEVVVAFIEGDPDRPLVVGTVYNDEYRFPYKLPDNKTQSGLKSDSTKGGGGYNEIKYEDKKGSEKIEVHAQKDLDTVVENNETRKIGEDQTIDVGETISVTAGKRIVLRVGQSTITVTETQVEVKSPRVKVNSMETEVKGSATITLQGGLVKIN
jgi:type VI secretion system secreted protein VgrG